jgi:hypothetical protein
VASANELQKISLECYISRTFEGRVASSDFALGEILPIIVHLYVAMMALNENSKNTNHWEPKF